jgi:hypothetical protein
MRSAQERGSGVFQGFRIVLPFVARRIDAWRRGGAGSRWGYPVAAISPPRYDAPVGVTARTRERGGSMLCEKCGKSMVFDYQVEERKVLFKLWNCECGYRFLEKKNLRRLERARIR